MFHNLQNNTQEITHIKYMLDTFLLAIQELKDIYFINLFRSKAHLLIHKQDKLQQSSIKKEDLGYNNTLC